MVFSRWFREQDLFLPVTRSIDWLLSKTAECTILYRTFLHICAHASVGSGNTGWPHMEVRIPRGLIEEEEIPTRMQAFAFTLNSYADQSLRNTRTHCCSNFKANHNADVTVNQRSIKKNRHSRLHHVRSNRSRSDQILHT